ncbi:MAG: D-aminoacylase [Verrucomicrobia bacterium]|nr:D-aminoacylase [Verrucomicrobiota bacterium]
MLDYKIINGTVYDGSGRDPLVADVGLRGERITAMGDLATAEAAQTIDATGHYVCPGFVDAHSHSDTYLIIQPDADSKLFQGITTEIVGNCGASAAPLHDPYKLPSDWLDKTYPAKWQTVADYREQLETARPAPNVVLLIGHNTLRAGAVGYEDRHATADELALMQHRLAEALDEGGAGLSTGLVYAPGLFAPREEIVKLADVVAARGKIYTSHMRSEGSRLLEAIEETISIGRDAGCRVQVSHLKTSGKKNWHLLDGALALIEAARADGMEVASDRYPYTASCTDLDVIFPDWAASGGRAAVLARLRDPSQRRRIREDILKTRAGDYWEIVRIGSTHHPDNERFKGWPLLDIAAALKLDPVDTVLYLTDSDELMTSAFFFGMSEANMWRILAQPYVMFGSDASLRAPHGQLSHDHPHPRAYGSLSRFIRASLDGETIAFAELVRKATSLPAQQFRLQDRGMLQPGKFADVVVLDPDRIQTLSDYGHPHQLSTGIEQVFVNGTHTMRDGKLTGQRAGRLLT